MGDCLKFPIDPRRVITDHLIERGTTSETPTVGLDPALQTLTTNPYNMGIIVPGAPPTGGGPYMFMLAKASAGYGQRLRVRGLRQYLSIAANIPTTNTESGPPNYLLEREITSTTWHFSDVPPPSWHLRRVPFLEQSKSSATTSNSEGLAFRDSDTPALLFENSATDVGGYTAPNGGVVRGDPLSTGLATFTDLRFKWRDVNDGYTMDVAYNGPCNVALYALLTQTVPGNQTILPAPGSSFVFQGRTFPDEDVFLRDLLSGYSQHAVYYRIAGSILWELETILPTDKVDGKGAY